MYLARSHAHDRFLDCPMSRDISKQSGHCVSKIQHRPSISQKKFHSGLSFWASAAQGMDKSTTWRAREIGRRPVKIANCSGYHGDLADEMYKQATLGNVDFITGDYLAGANADDEAETFALDEHEGLEETAWDSLRQTIDVINQKRIKVVINSGITNAESLAKRVAQLVMSKGYNLTIAYVSGENALPLLLSKNTTSVVTDVPLMSEPNLNEDKWGFNKGTHTTAPLVAARAYMGARGIVTGFRNGADIIICGRVSGASRALAAAWYWWGWGDRDYDSLAGALVAGHLIDCSAYVTGGDFINFHQYEQIDFVDPGPPIAEVASDGSCIITKHPGTGGLISVETVKSQLLYALQGNVYVHSDCKAVLDGIRVAQMSRGSNRVHVFGVTGLPPPPTTKLTVVYKGGYELQLLFNAAGYALNEKCDLFETKLRHSLSDTISDLDSFEVQRIGTPAYNPFNQNSSTVCIRIVAQSSSKEALMAVGKAVSKISSKHVHGFQSSMDIRTAVPRRYLAIHSTTMLQSQLCEQVHFIDNFTGGVCDSLSAGHPSIYKDLELCENYDTLAPATFGGPVRRMRLGDIALARSSDNRGNVGVGIFVQTPVQWEWLRSFLSRDRLKMLLHDDYKDWFQIQRVELSNIFAVHFVIHGIMGRSASSLSRHDGIGKGFADYLRDRLVDVPEEIL